MSEKRQSPFAGLGLDKALLRSTRNHAPAEAEPSASPDQSGDEAPRNAASDAVTSVLEPTQQAQEATTPADRRPVPPPRARASGKQRASSLQPGSDAANTAVPPMASTAAAPLSGDDAALIEAIRKAVKMTGKEVLFSRLTPAEKNQLADIVYTYKRQGKKTSETEIARIAINFILEEYRAHGEQSILGRVLERLFA